MDALRRGQLLVIWQTAVDRDHSKDSPGRDRIANSPVLEPFTETPYRGRIADGPVRYSISDSHVSDRIKDKCHVLFVPS